MNYVDAIALRVYRELFSGNPFEDGGKYVPLYRAYAVLALAKGTETTDRGVHDAWSAWCAGVEPDHRSLVPFAELSPATQDLDAPYTASIHRVARGLAR